MSNPVYVAHALMVCPSDLRAQAAAVAAQLSRNPADNTPDFFSRPLQSIESGKVTHYLSCSMATQITIDRLPALESLFPDAHWTVWRYADERRPRVEVGAWLADLGLEYVPDPPDEEK